MVEQPKYLEMTLSQLKAYVESSESISMVENVKGIGGSGYVVKKDATVLEEYFEK